MNDVMKLAAVTSPRPQRGKPNSSWRSARNAKIMPRPTVDTVTAASSAARSKRLAGEVKACGSVAGGSMDSRLALRPQRRFELWRSPS